MLTYLQREMEN